MFSPPFIIGTLLALTAVAVEAIAHRIRGTARAYRVRETLSTFGAFFGEAILSGLLGLGGLAFHALFVPHLALVDWSSHPLLMGPLGAALAFLAFDLVRYLEHRLEHRVNLFWALHHVHHQATAFNLTVAFRETWLKILQDVPVFASLSLLGLPVSWVLALQVVRTTWGLFQHTALVHRMGWLDAILATPSAHRVHHAKNSAYIDRNFGSITLLWDHLFGTYAAETEAPRFGTSDGWRAGSVIRDCLGPVVILASLAWRAPTWSAKLRLVLGRPTAFRNSDV